MSTIYSRFPSAMRLIMDNLIQDLLGYQYTDRSKIDLFRSFSNKEPDESHIQIPLVEWPITRIFENLQNTNEFLRYIDGISSFHFKFNIPFGFKQFYDDENQDEFVTFVTWSK